MSCPYTVPVEAFCVAFTSVEHAKHVSSDMLMPPPYAVLYLVPNTVIQYA